MFSIRAVDKHTPHTRTQTGYTLAGSISHSRAELHVSLAPSVAHCKANFGNKLVLLLQLLLLLLLSISLSSDVHIYKVPPYAAHTCPGSNHAAVQACPRQCVCVCVCVLSELYVNMYTHSPIWQACVNPAAAASVLANWQASDNPLPRVCQRSGGLRSGGKLRPVSQLSALIAIVVYVLLLLLVLFLLLLLLH